MTMKAYLIQLIIFIFYLFSLSPKVINSQQTDSCNTNLTISHLLPFNALSLNCISAWSSQNFILRYANTGPGLWSFILSALDTSSYVAIGFSDDGQMVGSSAVVGWSPPGGPGLIRQYYLGGKNPWECPPDKGDLKLVTGTSAILSQSSRLYLAFQVQTDQPKPYLINSVGPRNDLPSPSAGFLLSEHRDHASTSINYITGVISDAGEESAFSSPQRHGLLGMLGWGVLIPMGAAAARYCRNWDPQWFYAHMSVQGIGFALGLAGIVIGFKLDGRGVNNVDAHTALGIIVLALASLQIIALFARPDKSSKNRKYWNWYHHNVGRSVIAIATANIFFGLSIASEKSAWFIGYSVFLGLSLIICIIFEIKRFMSNE
ncbi:cytochrome b561 and DOMON domain-containing protein At3g07570 [Ananas comosus]|uniref:Cytochrome b561 and DOMON domain-containing protein At3g07570 n=1 Tax=Ananas comosus TaxID=4615 RepID=A0A6P5GSP4_ANACO|nr:cytochrome b561 and DOMON domain-containing protein At3g07570 [Ananas comosus]